MEMLIGGKWCGAVGGETEVVQSPYDGHPVDSVPVGGVDDAAAAIDGAEVAARVQRETPAHERFAVLLRAADLADERAEDIAQTLSAESGKPITEARGEAGRSGAIIRLAAFEGSQVYGSTLPFDANPGTGLEKVGFTLRQPCGIIVAISPFNFPALTVLHKIAPALAAGNAVVLKPARSTPLTALKLAQCFVDAGLAPGALSVLTGSGATLVHRLDGHRDPPGRGRGNQETVVGTGRLLPGDRAARRRHRHGRIRGGGRGLHQRRPGVHLGAAGDRRRTRGSRLPRRPGAQGRRHHPG